MRIVGINDQIYRIKEKDFKKILADSNRELIDKSCDYITKKYKPIFKMELMLRND